MLEAYITPKQSRFPLGDCYVTQAVRHTVAQEDIAIALSRHARGDWGEVCEEDRAQNDRSLTDGERLLSVYTDRDGRKFWIISERDRSATTVLFPDDY